LAKSGCFEINTFIDDTNHHNFGYWKVSQGLAIYIHSTVESFGHRLKPRYVVSRRVVAGSSENGLMLDKTQLGSTYSMAAYYAQAPVYPMPQTCGLYCIDICGVQNLRSRTCAAGPSCKLSQKSIQDTVQDFALAASFELHDKSIIDSNCGTPLSYRRRGVKFPELAQRIDLRID